MTNRATLRTYFRAGSLPTQQHFEELIESTLNMQDEGFTRSPANGVEIAQLEDHHAFLSLYEKADGGDPIWSLSGDDARHLRWRPGKAADGPGGPPDVLVLAPDGKIGVAQPAPEHTLDVAGTVRSFARLGGYIPESFREADGTAKPERKQALAKVIADGEWHDIIGPLKGCHAFEVMAGTGSPSTGRYSLLHAIAMNTFHPRRWPFDFLAPKRPIRETTAHYDRRCDRLQLRWFNTKSGYGRDSEYCLQIRSRCPYPGGASGKAPTIRCHITQLWVDRLMEHLEP